MRLEKGAFNEPSLRIELSSKAINYNLDKDHLCNTRFRGEAADENDITLIVLKFDPSLSIILEVFTKSSDR